MKILIITNGADNGGVGIAIKQAFDRFAPDWTVRSVRRANNFINYDNDIEWLPGDDRVGEQVLQLYHEADVVHVMEKFSAIEGFPDWERKPRIMHHHGAVFRGDPEGFVARCKRESIIQIGAIFDIIKLAPDDLIWVPNPVNLSMMLRYRAERYRPHSGVRIAQSPAGRGVNHTNQFVRIMGQLRGASLLMIEQRSWHDHLRLKATSDAIFDSFTTGYGITLSEGWGMGIPGIAGAADLDAMRIMVKTIGFTPYYPITEETAVEALQAFIDDPDLRELYADLGWQVVNEHHSEERVVAQLQEIYERAVQ